MFAHNISFFLHIWIYFTEQTVGLRPLSNLFNSHLHEPVVLETYFKAPSF